MRRRRTMHKRRSLCNEIIWCIVRSNCFKAVNQWCEAARLLFGWCASLLPPRCSPNQPAVTVRTKEWCNILSTHSHHPMLRCVCMCVTSPLFSGQIIRSQIAFYEFPRDEITPAVLARMTNSQNSSFEQLPSFCRRRWFFSLCARAMGVLDFSSRGGELSLSPFFQCRWSHSKHFRPKPLGAPSSAKRGNKFHPVLLDAWNFYLWWAEYISGEWRKSQVWRFL